MHFRILGQKAACSRITLMAPQVMTVVKNNFRSWQRNPRIYVTFGLAFVLCFLLTDKAVRFSYEYETIMQLVEPFVWTFGDSNSILLSSLLLLLLFADMPFLSPGTPFYLSRMDRKTWTRDICSYCHVYLPCIRIAFHHTSMHEKCLYRQYVERNRCNTGILRGRQSNRIACPGKNT